MRKLGTPNIGVCNLAQSGSTATLEPKWLRKLFAKFANFADPNPLLGCSADHEAPRAGGEAR